MMSFISNNKLVTIFQLHFYRISLRRDIMLPKQPNKPQTNPFIKKKIPKIFFYMFSFKR